MSEVSIWVPDSVHRIPSAELPEGRGTVVNDTDLPDNVVLQAVEEYFEEHSSVLGANMANNSFQNYANSGGSLLARTKFRPPSSIIEEIYLARDLAERDDDIAPTIGAMIAVAFDDPLQNSHRDEVVVSLFNEVARNCQLETRVLPEMYRELLIASQVTTATIFERKDIQFQPQGADRQRTRSIASPLVGVIPAELVRVIGNDMFGTARLAFRPATGAQEKWLEEFFDSKTSPGRKAEMRKQDPVLTTMLTEQIPWEEYLSAGAGLVYGDPRDPACGLYAYILNPVITARSTFPKGAWPSPRPLLTRNFPLLEAKRLLNLMDYALLEGGSNFLVVAKKGSDQRPALPEEITNLRDTVKRASRTGVLIGDHRLNIEIITPDLAELLNEKKRKLLGRKLTAALLRVPDFQDSDAGGQETARTDAALVEKTISFDRGILLQHVRDHVYEPTARRNDSILGAPRLWMPKIILQGLQAFTDMLLKLRDRGDIPRRYVVEAAGIDYDAAVAQRRQEKSSGDDRVLTPPPVPFTAQGQGGGGLNDNGGGRPAGGSRANGATGSQPSRSTRDGARPRTRVTQNQGETVRAMYDEDTETSVRVGELTYAILEEYADTKTIGRLTTFEQAALERFADGWETSMNEGVLTVIPVNVGEEIGEIRAIRLTTGLSLLVGHRVEDDAIMARAMSFRMPEFSALDAQERALRWGWLADPVDEPRALAPAPEPLEEEVSAGGGLAPVIHLHVETQGGVVTRTLLKDKDGNVVGSREEPEPTGGE